MSFLYVLPELIETSNASANAAMLSINRAMGFEVVARCQEWDVPGRATRGGGRPPTHPGA